MGVLGNTSISSASNFARTYGSEATQKSIQAAATANGINQQTMQMIMDFNHNEALLQREWEEAMSNTAYQRAITDMKSAGINPILAAMNGGASTPSGAAASGTALNAAMAQTFADQESAGSSYSQNVDNFAEALSQLAGALTGIGKTQGFIQTAENAAEAVGGFTRKNIIDPIKRMIHNAVTDPWVPNNAKWSHENGYYVDQNTGKRYIDAAY